MNNGILNMQVASLPISSIHGHIKHKLDNFFLHQRIPNLLFYGNLGTGKHTIVYNYIQQIYENNKEKLKTNVMFVNCAHGKGIKFIREDLKFFAKSNLKGTQGVHFKTIVLFNADNLTIDAQSALRRCIELFSYNTRFFIVVENKEKLLNPILSRFCEIHVPDILDGSGQTHNLHQIQLQNAYGPQPNHDDWFEKHIGDLDKSLQEYLEFSSLIYEEGYSCMDLIHWIKHSSPFEELDKTELIMYFHKIRCEYKNEKLLLATILCNMHIRYNKH